MKDVLCSVMYASGSMIVGAVVVKGSIHEVRSLKVCSRKSEEILKSEEIKC